MSHDDIVLSFTDEKIKSFIVKEFGEKGCYSAVNWVCNPVENWTIEELGKISVNTNIVSEYLSEAQKIRKIYLSNREEILNVHTDGLLIKKTFEYPVIKGDGQYKVTKGFIDCIVHISPKKKGAFCVYRNDLPREYLIEIKTEKDMSDMGSILRQIKEYRSYYGSCKKWESDLITSHTRKYPFKYELYGKEHRSNYLNSDFMMCLYIPRLKEAIVSLFANEGITCFYDELIKEEPYKPGTGKEISGWMGK